jgi:hypothetical protein
MELQNLNCDTFYPSSCCNTSRESSLNLCDPRLVLAIGGDTTKLSSKELTMSITSAGGVGTVDLTPDTLKLINKNEGQIDISSLGVITVDPAFGSKIQLDGQGSLISLSSTAGQDEIILNNNNQSITLKQGGKSVVYLSESGITLSSSSGDDIDINPSNVEWKEIELCVDGDKKTIEFLCKK